MQDTRGTGLSAETYVGDSGEITSELGERIAARKQQEQRETWDAEEQGMTVTEWRKAQAAWEADAPNRAARAAADYSDSRAATVAFQAILPRVAEAGCRKLGIPLQRCRVDEFDNGACGDGFWIVSVAGKRARVTRDDLA